MPPSDVFDGSAPEEKSPAAFKTIREVSDLLEVPTHVLRFWENKFSQLQPLKRKGGRRYYRPEDIATLTHIKHLLYQQGYTIKGAQAVVGKPGKAATMSPPPIKTEPSSPPVATRAPQNQAALLKLKAELSEMRAMLKAARRKS